jgi:energy-coupling factor transport system substrate-specific component
MTTQSGQQKKGGLASWSTRDLLVTAVIGIVFGLIAVPTLWVFTTLEMFTGPVGSRILIGIFFVPGLMAPYIIRRPGAAIIAQLIAALVQVPFSPYGWAVLMMVVTNGLPCELAFLLTRYKKYTLPTMMIAGVLVALPGFFMHAFSFGYFNLAPGVIVGSIVVQIISGALLGGWLAKALADAVAKTGVLASFAIGQEGEEI